MLSGKWVVDYVKKLSKQTNLKVIAVHQKNSFEFNCGFRRCINIGPGEFLSLIKNAKYVVTGHKEGAKCCEFGDYILENLD